MNAFVIETDMVSIMQYQDFASDLHLFNSDVALNKKMRIKLQWVTTTRNHHLKKIFIFTKTHKLLQLKPKVAHLSFNLLVLFL